MWVHYTVAFTLLDDLSVSCPRLRPCLLSDAKFLSKIEFVEIVKLPFRGNISIRINFT